MSDATNAAPIAGLCLIPQAKKKAERAAAWAEIAEHLRAHPREWFEVYTTESIHSATSASFFIRGSGYHGVMPDAVFMAHALPAGGGYRVVACYVGERSTYIRRD